MFCISLVSSSYLCFGEEKIHSRDVYECALFVFSSPSPSVSSAF